jgi:N-acetyl-anhydromuramyl-L-alanine amidase AmpD
MNSIIKITSIRQKYFEGFKRLNAPSEVVIHGTGGGSTAQGMIDWMLSGEREEEYKKGIALFHYLNDRDGKIYEIIDPDNWVYHSSSGRHDAVTIGIEHLKPDALNKTALTEEQYDSTVEFLVFLINKYPITSIIGHVMNTIKYSGPKYVKVPCPGEFDWIKLQLLLKNAGYNFHYESEHLIKGE